MRISAHVDKPVWQSVIERPAISKTCGIDRKLARPLQTSSTRQPRLSIFGK
ncbi:hypothetical protein SAMCCGM7_pC1827 (plasmid) [Sinorhizobium americanum CCGM7]|nr:hypothetical protein SAMCCGM7_pC1827 [Sinorhizobium americanum CCGM7]